MAYLNLPLDIRYRPENMYLAGIIPGPKQPSLEHPNHYIQPLMNDMVAAVIVLAVCDLPAACHLAALAGVSSHFFCSACDCYHKTNYSRTDYENWVPRDRDKLRRYAEQWRDAATSSEREKIFKEHGVCYSELWRLPYWDPSCQLVIDSMHCIFEGLANSDATHTATPAFHYNFKQVNPDAPEALAMTRKEIAQVSALHTLLMAQVPLPDDNIALILHKNTHSLKFVCQNLHCLPSKKGRILKADYAKGLVQWRVGMPLSATQSKCEQLATQVILGRIRNIIHDTATPSWLGSVPSNFGDVSTGTIKADEWHSLITIYLSIALISLWGSSIILDHTMDLVSAVYLASVWTMSAARAAAYRTYIATIHPTFGARPNHLASFHIYDYLLLFGPHLPTNHKSGELEITMLQSYLKATRLRGWLSHLQCPPTIQECKILLDHAYGSKEACHHIDEYPLNDSVRVPDTAKQTPVLEDLFRLTHQCIAVLHAHLKREGVIYSRSSMHIGNSLVLFYPKGDYNSSPVPGSIKYIYGSNGILTFTVQRQRPLLHGGQCDPFATYVHFPAKLYSSTVSDDLEIVKLSWVVSHFA
ncbi:hypothetical protein HD554DRAFT_2206411 [Boletus coccyginus]|nr:hypothetical protein HD554DRAFT_2206411 [Boletus coccyginus]